MTRASLFAKLNPIIQFLFQPVLILLWVGLLTYGVFIPLLNFYWDDLAIHWIAEVYGAEGLARYFSTNRPVWGWFYQRSISILGDSTWAWQAFGLFWRWVAATGLYFLLRQLWRDRKEPALWASFFFMVYPGFGQQYIAMVYGHFFLILSAFFYSLAFSLLAIHNPKKKFFLHGAALILSAVNLFAMEYFFMLELLRPFLMWLTLGKQVTNQSKPLKHIVRLWLPYLLLFIGASIWRAFVFSYQTENYEPATMQSVLSQPFITLWGLLLRVIQDFWTTLILPWGNVFQFPDAQTFGARALQLVAGLTLLTLLLLLIAFFIVQRKQSTEILLPRSNWLWALGLSLLAFLLAGIPFWLTDLPINLVFPYDRFTIPFMLAFSLFWTVIIFSLPVGRNIRTVLLIVLVSVSTAHQLQTGIKYQRDWEAQSRFFWQLLWRAPAIEHGTVVFAHELPLTYFSDNSLTAALNWIYDPEGGNDPNAIAYALYYPTIRVGEEIEDLQPGQDFSHDLLVGTFLGNTSQSLALFYQPPACLRILDPEIESDNWMVPLQVRDTIHLSNTNRISLEPQAVPPRDLYIPEPAHTWCYYFEKADLARQYNDWAEVVRLADIAFALDDYPNDPAERMPFIEGYAHGGNWQEAVAQTRAAAEVSPVIHPVLCRLWERIDRETEPDQAQNQAVESIFDQLGCANNQ